MQFQVSATSNNTSQKYKDGTYTGSGIGFKGGTTKVSVTIADGKITNIETLSNGDDRQYYERASGTIIKEYNFKTINISRYSFRSYF